ncbi:MAG: hypothetical protein QNJ97_27730 [Myxococcota bacterium]|nr:hypothetical protein [Myxococcota bacterium]
MIEKPIFNQIVDELVDVLKKDKTLNDKSLSELKRTMESEHADKTRISNILKEDREDEDS